MSLLAPPKIGKDELWEAVSCFGQVFACAFCMHPHTPLARRVFGEIPFYHRNPVCQELKRTRGANRRCLQFDRRYVHSHLKSSAALFFKRCHWGIAELVIPVTLRDTLAASFFAGPFRTPPGTLLPGPVCSLPTLVPQGGEALLEGLPVLDQQKAHAMLIFGKMLGEKMDCFLSQEAEQHEDGSRPTRKSLVENFLESNFTNSSLALDDLASHLSLSRTHTSRLVLKVCGCGFSELLLGQRLAAVAKLLTNTEYSIRSIAGMCGFASSEYLHRTFRRRFGVTPNAYRVTCGEKAEKIYDGIRAARM